MKMGKVITGVAVVVMLCGLVACDAGSGPNGEMIFEDYSANLWGRNHFFLFRCDVNFDTDTVWIDIEGPIEKPEKYPVPYIARDHKFGISPRGVAGVDFKVILLKHPSGPIIMDTIIKWKPSTRDFHGRLEIPKHTFRCQ